MDASGADKLILLVQTNQVLYDKSAARYKVKDALEKGDIWQIGVDIAVNSERTTDLRCRFSFLVSRWRCDRSVRFLVSRFSFLVSRFSFLGGGVTGPLRESTSSVSVQFIISKPLFAVCRVIRTHTLHNAAIFSPGAGFMNRRRLCQLTAAILTSD